ncbi:CPBP family intramembrane glutamic endopeptidase [Aeromicrobium chenweiae]|uniref:CPBP family intramembrane metalloprotease domain-containing protein n=1 Tax=Aeromicrobium chenweiae TaxID=2079793 RepID=A0A2S0WHU3_9ACTN|nr:type II CAAX endopeptidase family protein [Aeromicrobium chenweiae]AWB90800.1 CPBP family intramembrane metalloprotease domain-containing protein [Aeromicrobium chenweiae]TGN31063.1 CPBP family intramembrane metalloprotease [Aeromicrobium chenweiae]
MATPYQRQARETPAYAWWKLPVVGLLTVVFYLGLTIVLVVAGATYLAIKGGGTTVEDWLDATGDLDLAHLDFFVLDLLGLAILTPALLLAVLVVGPRPVGYFSSVAGRLRWGWLARTAAISFTVFIVTIGASVAIDAANGEDVDIGTGDRGHMVLAIVLVLLVVPFQAAAEEYVFRGYVLQLVGSWTRFAAIPVIVSVPIFVAGHAYELWGLVDVGIFGLTAAILVIRTGGLEAAIAAHVANNVVLFVLDALGTISASDDTGATAIDVLPTVVSSVVLLVWIEWSARRHGIQRTREPLPVPPPPQAPMWPPPPWGLPQDVAPWLLVPQHAPQQVQQPPVPPRAPAPPLHPGTPPYPGEIDPDWGR